MSEINSKILDLSSLEKTMLIPLWARAEETLHGGLINDELSVKLIEKIDTSVFAFDQMNTFIRNYLLTAIANRTILIDNFLEQVINKSSVVYNLGCGLDTRYIRYKDRVKKWIDVDLSGVIDLRKELISESENYNMIHKNIMVESLDFMESGAENIMICEGLLMYFKASEVRNLLSKMIDNSKSGHIIIETLGGMAKLKVNPVIKGIGENSRYTWTLNNTQDYRKLDTRMKIVDSKSIFDLNKQRWNYISKLMKFKYLKDRVSSKISLYEY